MILGTCSSSCVAREKCGLISLWGLVFYFLVKFLVVNMVVGVCLATKCCVWIERRFRSCNSAKVELRSVYFSRANCFF